MPGGDGTGPGGMGPMTGRGAGYCAGYSVPGYMNPIPGRGFGFGMGRGWGGGGRGWRHQYYATGLPGWMRAGYGPAWGAPAYGAPAYGAPYAPGPTKEQEIEMLKDQADYFKQALDSISERLEELEAES